MKKPHCFLGLMMGALTLAMPQTGAAADANTNGIDARMFRYADVSATRIVFVYAGDLWVAPKAGGVASHLSSPKGEESFPRFSPDGSQIAFTGNYDGSSDIYVVPATGGLPRRVTYHGAPDRMLDWYPDGKSLLFASSRMSEKDRFNQLFKIPASGGLAEKLPLPYGEFGSISEDGRTLAYVPVAIDLRTWKRYRGGMNPAIWLFDLESHEAKNLTGSDAANTQPMWHGGTLYFLSDRDKNKRSNIWAADVKTGKLRQITQFEQFDIHFPSIGPEDIVFENGGRLYLLSLADEKYHEVNIQVVTDRATLKPRSEDVSRFAREFTLSPSGKRVALEARGEIFTVPAEHGVVRNLTRSSGVAERFPAWSPDGKLLAYFSDRSGEYELTVRPADGTGEEQTLTQLGVGYRYHIYWSPDSKKVVFIDQAMRVMLHDLDKKETKEIARQFWLYQGNLNNYKVNWSKDSRWVAFPQDLENRHTAVVIYDTKEKKAHQVSSGYYDDDEPVFDPEGKYLYYKSGRSFTPMYGDLDNTWIYPNTYQLLAVALRKDVASPFIPRNDDEIEKKKDKDKEESKDKKKPDEAAAKKEEGQPKDKKADEAKDGKDAVAKSDKPKGDEKDEKKEEKPPKPVEIDFEGFERRAVVLPAKAGYYADLLAVNGKVLYRRLPRAGAADEKAALMLFDFEKREEKTVLDDVDGVELAAKGEKILVHRHGDHSIVEPKEGQKMDKKVAMSGLESVIDPVAEWQQIFTETWRLERDFFYDPGMHGVDWKMMRERYGALMKDAVTRWDVNYVIGELISELSASHTYRSGGVVEGEAQRGVGYLGVDFSRTNGFYRIARIIDGADWDAGDRSPLKMPAIDVKEGDYLLAVNGTPLDMEAEPYAAFQGLADKPVFLTVNSTPGMQGSREVLVLTIASESRLRHLAWIEGNRKKVEELSKGQIGYVYVPDTGQGGQNELVRQFRAQFMKPGLVIDERFNSGGQIPDRFTEMLGRRNLNHWGVRDGRDWIWPEVAHNGPKAMLANGWSGSGGDCFPYYFQQAKLGPVVGSRTWGGLIGITGTPPLMDDGHITVPTFGIFNNKGEWIIEGVGVEPDINVVDDPSIRSRGRDPQLERAVSEVLDALKKNPPTQIKKPKYPVHPAS